MSGAPEEHRFDDDGRGFPNSALPLLVYRGALPPDPAAMERAFAANGWSNPWRDGIFRYHHFHSIAHEVLGIAAGEARVAFGGPSGREVTVRAGDVVVIPAGVAHRNMGQSADLLVVGAYPGGADYDIRKGDPAEREAAVRAIAAVPLPDSDPVSGRDGPLPRLWTGDGGPAEPAAT
ncbi:MAG: cupin domain-containing protein [Acetobacteraceae bacterium]|nr:cupin domain-containing protein [Acetobacteraceae bacterium]